MFELLKSLQEDDGDAGVDTSNVASVESPLFKTKKKKKKVIKPPALKEDASVGSVNVADFSNDFGTDSPRLPSELGDLTGKKSLGMGSGFTEYNLKINDPFTGKKYNLLRVLNKQGHNHAGGATTQPPVLHSPYNEYVKGAEFIFKTSDHGRGKAAKHEKNTRAEHRSLKKMLQKAFIDSFNNKTPINKDPESFDKLITRINKVTEKEPKN